MGSILNMLQRCATILNCDTMKMLFKYLGMLVRGCHKKKMFSEGMVDRVRNKLGR